MLCALTRNTARYARPARPWIISHIITAQSSSRTLRYLTFARSYNHASLKTIFAKTLLIKTTQCATIPFTKTAHPFTKLTPYARVHTRGFHATNPARVPLIPLPAFIVLIGKSGVAVKVITWISRVSLTLLPHSLVTQNYRLSRILISIPLLGIVFVLAVGADNAPNTGRLRFMFLTEEEEREICMEEVNQALESSFALVLPDDNEWVLYVQEIADNIARVAVDPADAPVRSYSAEGFPEPKKFKVSIIADDCNLNAVCYGASNHIIFYSLMLKFTDYQEDTIASILAHEISHCLQRHFVEQHAFESLFYMIWDFGRGIFWPVLELAGPYANEVVNDWIKGLSGLYINNTYNRACEREADLVGLKLAAKAGYNPLYALKFWDKMSELEKHSGRNGQIAAETVKKDPTHEEIIANETISTNVNTEKDILSRMLTVWFGETHPPSKERVAYLYDNMDEAVAIYEESRRINGPPTSSFVLAQQVTEEGKRNELLGNWIKWFTDGFGSLRGPAAR